MARALNQVGQGSVRSKAAALGTLAIETARTFRPVEEAYWLSESQRQAYYRDTSQHAYYGQYWGRGYIQLTLESNYRAAGAALGVDLIGHPQLVMDPPMAARVFAWYWAGRNLQEAADREDWRECRRRVQGAYAGAEELVQMANQLLNVARSRGAV